MNVIRIRQGELRFVISQLGRTWDAQLLHHRGQLLRRVRSDSGPLTLSLVVTCII